MPSASRPASCLWQRPVVDADRNVRKEEAYKNRSLEYFPLIPRICGFQTFWATGKCLHRFSFVNTSNRFFNSSISPRSWDYKVLQLSNVLCEVSLFACFKSATCSCNLIPSQSSVKQTMNPVPCLNIYATCDFICFYHLLQNLGW